MQSFVGSDLIFVFHDGEMKLMETGGGFGFGDFGGRSGGSANSSAEAAALTKSLRPFTPAATATAAAALADTLFLCPSSSLPGGMMGNSRAAFTLAQMEELERQKLIFRYMVAYIPVPPQLLLPLKSNTIIGSTRISGSSSSDPEPWRCKRTDGKKWRCSRDVAPHQKYCERHSHKNRPRSRKPVEFLSSNTSNKPPTQSTDSNFISSSITSPESLTHLAPYQAHKAFSHSTGSAIPRSLEWFMKGEVIALPNSGQLEWQHPPEQLQHQQYGTLSPYEPHQELQAQGVSGLVNERCSLLLGMASSEGHDCPKDSASLSKRVPTSSLSLAIFGRGGVDGEEGKDDERESIGQMGFRVGPNNVANPRECDRRAESKPHWMNPGGPLAEALCLGSSSIHKSSPSDQT